MTILAYNDNRSMYVYVEATEVQSAIRFYENAGYSVEIV